MYDVNQCFVRGMIVQVYIIFGEDDIFGNIMLCESFPFRYAFILIIVRKFIKDNEYLKVWIVGGTDIRCFAEHILKVVIGVL